MGHRGRQRTPNARGHSDTSFDTKHDASRVGWEIQRVYVVETGGVYLKRQVVSIYRVPPTNAVGMMRLSSRGVMVGVSMVVGVVVLVAGEALMVVMVVMVYGCDGGGIGIGGGGGGGDGGGIFLVFRLRSKGSLFSEWGY